MERNLLIVKDLTPIRLDRTKAGLIPVLNRPITGT